MASIAEMQHANGRESHGNADATGVEKKKRKKDNQSNSRVHVDTEHAREAFASNGPFTLLGGNAPTQSDAAQLEPSFARRKEELVGTNTHAKIDDTARRRGLAQHNEIQRESRCVAFETDEDAHNVPSHAYIPQDQLGPELYSATRKQPAEYVRLGSIEAAAVLHAHEFVSLPLLLASGSDARLQASERRDVLKNDIRQAKRQARRRRKKKVK